MSQNNSNSLTPTDDSQSLRPLFEECRTFLKRASEGRDAEMAIIERLLLLMERLHERVVILSNPSTREDALHRWLNGNPERNIFLRELHRRVAEGQFQWVFTIAVEQTPGDQRPNKNLSHPTLKQAAHTALLQKVSDFDPRIHGADFIAFARPDIVAAVAKRFDEMMKCQGRYASVLIVYPTISPNNSNLLAWAKKSGYEGNDDAENVHRWIPNKFCAWAFGFNTIPPRFAKQHQRMQDEIYRILCKVAERFLPDSCGEDFELWAGPIMAAEVEKIDIARRD